MPISGAKRRKSIPSCRVRLTTDTSCRSSHSNDMEAGDVAHMDARAYDATALTDRLQRQRDEIANSRIVRAIGPRGTMTGRTFSAARSSRGSSAVRWDWRHGQMIGFGYLANHGATPSGGSSSPVYTGLVASTRRPNRRWLASVFQHDMTAHRGLRFGAHGFVLFERPRSGSRIDILAIGAKPR